MTEEGLTTDWFVSAVTREFDYLISEYGYSRATDQELHLRSVDTIAFVGPVAVVAVLEPLIGLVEVSVQPLVEGKVPTIPPIVSLSVHDIVSILSPSRAQAYEAIPQRSQPASATEYLSMAAMDLRTFATELLEGDTTIVADVRRRLAHVPGVVGVDWWVSARTDRPAGDDPQ